MVDPLRAVCGESLRCWPTRMAKMRTVGADGGTAVCGCCRECQLTAMTMFGLSYEGALLTCGRFSTCERPARPLWSTPTAALLMLGMLMMLMSSPITLLAMMRLLLGRK